MHRNGNVVWGALSTAVVRGPQGEPLHLVSQIQDVTEPRRIEQALRESEFFFKESQRAGFIGSYKTDFIAGRWESSEVLDAIFGIDRHYSRTVEGWLDLVHPDDREAMAQYLSDEVIAKRQPFGREYRMVRKSDGMTRWVNGLGAVDFDGEGRLLSLIGTIQDITDRKRLEAEVEQQRVRALQVDRLRALGEMAAGVAHELNQPLNGIRAFAEGALLGPQIGWSLSPDETVQTFEDIVVQVDRISGIVDHMRAFARGETDSDPVAFDLAEPLSGALKLMGTQLRVHGITLRDELAANLPRCWGWANELEQVLLNLLSNARDALEEQRLRLRRAAIDGTAAEWSPQITIGAVADGAVVRLSVSDNGGGMPPTVASRIFEPFFTTKDVGKGTGIGLAIVRSIIERHRGTIEVANRAGDGVTFTISLPVASPEV